MADPKTLAILSPKEEAIQCAMQMAREWEGTGAGVETNDEEKPISLYVLARKKEKKASAGERDADDSKDCWLS